MEQREIDNMLLRMIQKHFPSLPLSDEHTDWGKWLGFARAVYESGRASPASAPECVTFIPDRIRKVESGFKGLFIKEAKAYKQGWNDCRAAMLSAAPTTPVSEDRKDAERFRDGWTHSCNALCVEIELWIDRCPHCGRPAPKAPTMQEDKQ